MTSHGRRLMREPLFRILLINLAAGFALALLLVGGLWVLNPHGLRDLILSDHAPATALILLLFSFFITFGSVAMGSAIMAIGSTTNDPAGGRRLPARPLPIAVRQTALLRQTAKRR